MFERRKNSGNVDLCRWRGKKKRLYGLLENVKKIIEQETGKNLKEMESKAGKYTQQYNSGHGKYPFPVK